MELKCKIIFIVMLLGISMSLIGCSSEWDNIANYILVKTKDDNDTSSNAYVSISSNELNAEANRIYEVVVSAFDNEDVELLKSEFSDYVKDRADLDSQIESAYKFVDGKVIEIENVYAGDGYGERDEQGDVKVNYNVSLFNVKTDKGRDYTFRVYGVYYYRDHDDKKGISYIYIDDNDIEEDENTGEQPDGRIKIGGGS